MVIEINENVDSCCYCFNYFEWKMNDFFQIGIHTIKKVKNKELKNAPPLPWPRLHLGHVGMAIIDSLMELRPAFNQCILYRSFNEIMDFNLKGHMH